MIWVIILTMMASQQQQHQHDATIPRDSVHAPVPEHQQDVPLGSSRFLPGWENAGRPLHHRFQGKGHVLNDDAITHREFKASKGKKAIRAPPPPPVYQNRKFTPCQEEMARALHLRYNVIADWATSCGKTWAANLITAYEILSRDTAKGAKATGLIIAPNSEVMRDSVNDIGEHHNKLYQYGGTHMMDTMTRNFATYDERRGPSAQLIVVAVECIESFVTDPINRDFVKSLEIIVFDEVHLGPVTRALWWSQYIPHTAQLVLLSATLGDPEEVRQTVEQLQSLQMGRPLVTHIIHNNVRPIPLQPLVFKGLVETEKPTAGPKSKNLKTAKKLACLINRFDPTRRDLMSLLMSPDNPQPDIPEDRDLQYEMGQQVVEERSALVIQKLEEGLQGAQLNPTAENIYDLLCYLFSNDKQPAMVFNTTAGATEHLCRTVIGHIAEIERHDEEFKLADKQFQTYQKESHRARDKKSRSKAMEKEKGDWNKALPDEPREKINIHEVSKMLRKWRFPSDLQPKDIPENMPQWIKDALEYGIGVYVSSMKIWQRHFMFDHFRAGKIKVLFSDSTISVGINLPIRTVVMCGSMSRSLYKQASGRAGRRGMDDQGFIVHMMPEPDIIKCLTTKEPEMHLHIPTRMNHSDLIRTLVPGNLQNFYYIDPGVAKKTGETVPEFDGTEAKPIPEYSREILMNYLNSLSDDDYDRCIDQIRMIHKEQWHYHRLTNIVKTLPEKTSIILVKIMAMGVLHQFELTDLYHLIALLFNRVEWDGDPESEKDYYVPSFPSHPDLMSRLVKASEIYGLDVDFNKPIHRYFFDFCRKQIVYPNLLPQIEAMGEWLYTFKLGVMSVCPKEGRGRRAKPTDKFVKMLLQADMEYLAARTSKSI
jgi:superfamily II DNA or RNA helicase